MKFKRGLLRLSLLSSLLLLLSGCKAMAEGFFEGVMESVVNAAIDDDDYSRVRGAKMPERYQQGFREQDRIDRALRDFDQSR